MHFPSSLSLSLSLFGELADSADIYGHFAALPPSLPPVQDRHFPRWKMDGLVRPRGTDGRGLYAPFHPACMRRPLARPSVHHDSVIPRKEQRRTWPSKTAFFVFLLFRIAPMLRGRGTVFWFIHYLSQHEKQEPKPPRLPETVALSVSVVVVCSLAHLFRE